VMAYAQATAQSLYQREEYIRAVLQADMRSPLPPEGE
jgi:hypothetical protein